jgi:hypothetical protein
MPRGLTREEDKRSCEMRLRRASVLAALPLLAWVATAYAECAWVLWGSTSAGRARIVQSSLSAPDRQQCEAELSRGLQDLTSRSIFPVCSVDPHGPRGKLTVEDTYSDFLSPS